MYYLSIVVLVWLLVIYVLLVYVSFNNINYGSWWWWAVGLGYVIDHTLTFL